MNRSAHRARIEGAPYDQDSRVRPKGLSIESAERVGSCLLDHGRSRRDHSIRVIAIVDPSEGTLRQKSRAGFLLLNVGNQILLGQRYFVFWKRGVGREIREQRYGVREMLGGRFEGKGKVLGAGFRLQITAGSLRTLGDLASIQRFGA